MKTCNDIMTKNPSCCTVSEPITSAVEIMRAEDVGAVPVIESNEAPRLIGMITDRDVVIRVVAEGRDYRSMTIGEIMSGDPVTCRADDPLQEAIERMGQNQIRRMPVVDENGHVVGIISQADIATRVSKPKRTAGVLEDISQPVA